MLLYSTPPLPGCSCPYKVKGSNESSSFPLFLYFLFNYLQAVQVLLYFPSPYAALSSWFFLFFLFRTVHLASLPFLSPQCVPPALLRSAVFVTSTVHICWLSPPRHPLLLGHQVSLCFTRAFLPGGPSASQKRNNSAMATAPVFMLPAPLHRSRGTHVAPVVQLIGSKGKDSSAAA